MALRHAERMLQLGVLLLLLGLLTGLVVPALAVPRLGVSAHIVGVMSGMLLILLGLVWPRLRVGHGTSRAGCWLALYSSFAGWPMPLLGGAWGAGSSMLPFAAGPARGTPLQEGIIAAGLVSAAAAGIAVCALVLWGLRGPAPDREDA